MFSRNPGIRALDDSTGIQLSSGSTGAVGEGLAVGITCSIFVAASDMSMRSFRNRNLQLHIIPS
jgi:hypothetical protein